MKKPYLNPAVYAISVIFVGVFVYYLVTTASTVEAWQIIIFSVVFMSAFSYLFIQTFRPFHPITFKDNKLLIKRYYAKTITIDLSDIRLIEKWNRYDTIHIETSTKKYNLSFMLNSDDFVTNIQKKLKKQNKNTAK